MYTATVIILLIIIGILVYLVWNQTDKLRQTEKRNQEYSQIITSGMLAMDDLLEETERIRAKELFEKDDEVGVIFEQMYKIIEIYNQFMKKLIVDVENQDGSNQ